jgi:acyl transferase domain-containing protein
MDPMARVLLECVYEAIIDAGVNPKDLYGTKTGVFIGTCYSEVEKVLFYGKPEVFSILLLNNNDNVKYFARNYMLLTKKILVNVSSHINTYLYVHIY